MHKYWITAANHDGQVIYNKMVTAPTLALALENVKDQVPAEHHGSICITDESNNQVEQASSVAAIQPARGTFLKTTGHRFLVSSDGLHADWIHPLELVSRPGWTDCTDMDDEQFQRFVAERQTASKHAALVGA